MSVKIKVVGDKEIAKLLSGFSKPSLQRQAVRPGVRSAGAMFRKEAKKTAPQDEKDLKKSMRSVVRTSRNGDVYAVVGPEDKKTSDGKNPARYAHLTENDVKSHVIPGAYFEGEAGKKIYAPKAKHPGYKGKKWMQKAFNRKFEEARQVMLTKTRDQYYKIVEKRRKAGKSL